MIGNQSLFVFLTLCLVMIINISTAPVREVETTTDHVGTGGEEKHETTSIPEVVTDDLLFFDVTKMPMDKSVKTDGVLLFNKEGDVPVTPEPDGPRSYMNPEMSGTVITPNYEV